MTFGDFARDHGLLVERIIPDGRVHRVPTTLHPKKRNGAYAFDGQKGFVQAWDMHEAAIPFRPRDEVTVTPISVERADALAARARQQIAQERAQAAQRALSLVQACTYDTHPYLVSKGFPDARGLVDSDERLVVPMRDVQNYGRVTSVQTISRDGDKRFLKGGQARGSVFRIGKGWETWLVEGYATGLSVDAALRSMYRQASVVVTFSAGNLTHVAGLLSGPRYVVADHDVSGTGEAAAKATGLPWAMSEEQGEDANDLMQRGGLEAVRELIGRVLQQ